MPYLVYLGSNPRNLGGTSAKGYWIYRRGSRVVARWGPVESVGGRGGRFVWRSGPTGSKEWSFTSEAEAGRHLATKVREKEGDGYDLLPSKRKIESG
jgi:hypothetical protein